MPSQLCSPGVGKIHSFMGFPLMERANGYFLHIGARSLRVVLEGDPSLTSGSSMWLRNACYQRGSRVKAQ